MTIILQSKSAFTDTLFNPVNGHTADGYVSKRLKTGVVVWLAGTEYMVNRHKVWCNMTRQHDGKVWYSHAVIDSHLNKYLGYMAQHDAADALLAGNDYISPTNATSTINA